MMIVGVAPFLPEDVIRNILKRLSVKSLIRFQCVCRDWKNLINAPSFIADHLHHSTHHNPCLLFQPKCKGLHPSQLYLLDRQMQVHQLLNPPLFDASRFKIKGSSNGLLCVQLCVEINAQDTCPPPLLLWNPATREVIMLPMIIDDFFSESDSHLGFGFSPIVNDYKIVRTYAEYEYEIYRGEVFSLSTGSWKVVEFDYMAGTRFLTDAITANGSMFWTGLLIDLEMVGDDIDVIVSFDIASEVFEFVPLPAFANNAIYHPMVCEDKLAIYSHTTTADTDCMFDLWLMEERVGASDEERRSWTKIFSSTCSSIGLLFPSIFWRNELVYNIFEIPGHGDETKCEAENGVVTFLCLLNISTNGLEMFTTTRRCGDSNARIFNYVESLASVGKILIEEPSS